MKYLHWAAVAAFTTGIAPAHAGATYAVIHSFVGTDGANPLGALLVATDGTMYGTAVNSGTNYAGAIFQLTPPAAVGGTWSATAIYSFAGPDGQTPYGDLIFSRSDGGLFGTTFSGGANNDGTVYRLIPPTTAGGAWTHQTLHDLDSAVDGENPRAGLFHCGAGLCGTAAQGGPAGFGTVFRLQPIASQPTGYNFKLLYQFTGTDTGSSTPYSELISDGANGIISTTTGYLSGTGVAYHLTPNALYNDLPWQYTDLHSFGFSTTDGYVPMSAPVRDASGALYGSASSGGTTAGGVVYQLTPPATAGASWTSTVLVSFGKNCKPEGGLIADRNGGFFGTTYACGSAGFGTVFHLLPPTASAGWHAVTLHSFTGGPDGEYPTGALVRGLNGIYYGTTSGGGTGNVGTVYSIAP